MKNNLIIGNVTFIFDKERTKVLLLKRAKEPMKGCWTGVGGKTSFEEDLHLSALREIKEETNLEAENLKLKGILKTILKDLNSSWILFIYTADSSYSNENQVISDEGILKWVDIKDIENYNMIGFIKEIFPNILNEKKIFEGTIVHDDQGDVVYLNLW